MLPNSSTFDYRDDFSDNLQGGVVVLQTEDRRVTEYDLGDGRIVRKTESLIAEELLEQNHQCMIENQNERWGDGQIAASIPLNVFYDKLGQAVKEGNQGYIKKWLNDSDNKMYPTFPGQI
jgi:hypothetical protein